MKAKLVERAVDEAVAALATSQHGIVTREQLRAIGLSDSAIGWRISVGRLRRLHRGVFAVGHEALRGEARWLAAVLACGEGAALSHESAASAWAVRPSASARIDVSVPVAGGRDVSAPIRVHRIPGLLASDITTHLAIPTTTPMRTLFDLAGSVRPHALRRAATTSIDLQLFDLAALDGLLTRHPRRQGARPLRAMLIYLRDSEPITRSELERRFLRICRSASVPTPSMNVDVAGFQVDAVWREHRLAVELDGRRWHEARLAMAADRARDRRLTIAGWRPVRFTWTDVVHDRAGVIADVRDLLG